MILMRIQNLLWYIERIYRKPTHTAQYTYFSSNEPLHVKLSTIKTLVKREKFICSDETSLNEVLSYFRKTMQLNGYPLNIINKTIQNTLQNHNSERKSKELKPLKIPCDKGVAEKLKRIAKIWVYNSLYKKKDLRR